MTKVLLDVVANDTSFFLNSYPVTSVVVVLQVKMIVSPSTGLLLLDVSDGVVGLPGKKTTNVTIFLGKRRLFLDIFLIQLTQMQQFNQ